MWIDPWALTTSRERDPVRRALRPRRTPTRSFRATAAPLPAEADLATSATEVHSALRVGVLVGVTELPPVDAVRGACAILEHLHWTDPSTRTVAEHQVAFWEATPWHARGVVRIEVHVAPGLSPITERRRRDAGRPAIRTPARHPAHDLTAPRSAGIRPWRLGRGQAAFRSQPPQPLRAGHHEPPNEVGQGERGPRCAAGPFPLSARSPWWWTGFDPGATRPCRHHRAVAAPRCTTSWCAHRLSLTPSVRGRAGTAHRASGTG